MNNSLYRNFYKNFLLVMLLPTSVLTITLLFFNGYVLIQNMANLSSNTGSVLEKELTYYTKQLSGCRNTLISESIPLTISSGMDSYSKFQLIRKLDNFKNILGYCRNIGIIDMQSEKVISSDGEITLSLFLILQIHNLFTRLGNLWILPVFSTHIRQLIPQISFI